MKLNLSFRRTAVVLGLAALASPFAIACGTSTPEAVCAFVVGDGQNGHDTKIHRIVLPGDNTGSTNGEAVRYIPCGPRNYIVNDGTEKDASGQPVGDRHTPSHALTTEKTPTSVWSNTYFTVNQSDVALRKLYELCYKYNCFSDSAQGGNVNASTDGWNKMLAENFGPTVDDVAIAAMPTQDDNIWKYQDAGQRVQLGKDMSDKFAASMRLRTGDSLNDLFCGSGSSGWNENHTQFNCTAVRVVIPRVDRYVPNAQEAVSNPEAQQRLNLDSYNAAKARYGSDAAASYWLGLQDTVGICKGATVPCQIVVGNPPVK